MRAILPGWPWLNSAAETPESGGIKAGSPAGSDQHLLRAANSLRDLLSDTHIPDDVRADLEEDYRQVESMCDKLVRGDLHIAVFGKVSSGKSSLLNALIGEPLFPVSPLHGETKRSSIHHWTDLPAGGVHLIDTPGINEMDGEAREKLAYEVADRSDLVLFVADGDLTETELEALRILAAGNRPLLLVLNKIDRYTTDEQERLLDSLRRHSQGLVKPENIIAAAADPRSQTVVIQRADGSEITEQRAADPVLDPLKERVWTVLEAEGKTLAALNAALFAGRLSDQVAERIADARRATAERITRTYSLTKGVAVALNPVPVADLLAAAALDIALVSQLSQAYGLPMGRRESGRLLATIIAQLAALMGAVWGVHLVSSALKTVSAGLSVTVTGAAQGALAYYATYLVGRAAEEYLIRGKSWGDQGPKQTVKDIVDGLDRNSILSDAREQILQRLRRKTA